MAIHTRFLLASSALALAGLACGGGRLSPTDSAPTEPAAPAATPTPYPTPIPPANTPAALPSDSDLVALIEYANQMQPLIYQAGVILQRDGEILKQAEGENDQVLCDGRLEADNSAFKPVADQARGIQPPSDAQALHDLVLRGADAWSEALDNVAKFCDTGNALYKVPAALKFWEAALSLQDAGNRFWALLVSEGVQDWVRR